MLVNVKNDKSDGLSVDENVARLIPELLDLINDSKYGIQAVAFVALCYDPDSFFVKAIENEKTRKEEVVKSVWKDAGPTVLKSKKLQAAIDKYENLALTPIARLKNQYQSAVVKIGKFVEDAKIDKDNAKELIDNLAKMPSLINNFAEMDEAKSNDVDKAKGIVTGGRELTWAETKAKKRNIKRR